MKSTKRGNAPKAVAYPYLFETVHTKSVWLLTGNGKGTCVHAGTGVCRLGQVYDGNLDMQGKPFVGSLTLEN